MRVPIDMNILNETPYTFTHASTVLAGGGGRRWVRGPGAGEGLADGSSTVAHTVSRPDSLAAAVGGSRWYVMTSGEQS